MELLRAIFFGWPLFAVFLAIGIYLGVRTRFVQFSRIGVIVSETLGAIRERNLGGGGQISPFQATMVALCGTVGVGSIVAVTAGILLGGPGAILWMWVFGLIGMAAKFAEATLAQHFRKVYNDGSIIGGPAVYLARGLKLPNLGPFKIANLLGGVFAMAAIAAAFSAGNLSQVAGAASSIESSFNIPGIITGLVLAIVVFIIIAGGPVRIARVAGVLFPVMALVMVSGALVLIIKNIGNLPGAIGGIFTNAFSFDASASGLASYGVLLIITQGFGRSVFSTASGLGISSTSHAQAQVDHPVRQGFWGVVEVFIGLVVSTLTALAVLSAPNAWRNNLQAAPGEVISTVFRTLGVSGESDFNPALVAIGSGWLSIGIMLFAIATMIAWAFYAEEAAGYLFGDGIRWPFRIVWVGVAFLAPLGNFQDLLGVSEALIGIMALPNLIGLALLAPVVFELTNGFFNGEPYDPPSEGPKDTRETMFDFA
jgi:alanine or glycine:cation symporter, AGCS family